MWDQLTNLSPLRGSFLPSVEPKRNCWPLPNPLSNPPGPQATSCLTFTVAAAENQSGHQIVILPSVSVSAMLIRSIIMQRAVILNCFYPLKEMLMCSG